MCQKITFARASAEVIACGDDGPGRIISNAGMVGAFVFDEVFNNRVLGTTGGELILIPAADFNGVDVLNSLTLNSSPSPWRPTTFEASCICCGDAILSCLTAGFIENFLVVDWRILFQVKIDTRRSCFCNRTLDAFPDK